MRAPAPVGAQEWANWLELYEHSNELQAMRRYRDLKHRLAKWRLLMGSRRGIKVLLRSAFVASPKHFGRFSLGPQASPVPTSRHANPPPGQGYPPVDAASSSVESTV